MSNFFGVLVCARASEAERARSNTSTVVLRITVLLIRMLRPHHSHNRPCQSRIADIIHPPQPARSWRRQLALIVQLCCEYVSSAPGHLTRYSTALLLGREKP